MKEKEVEIVLLKDIVKSTKSTQRIKDHEIKKLSLQIQKLRKIIENNEEEKKFVQKKNYAHDKSTLSVLNEFNLEESINNLILENKEIYEQEIEKTNKETNSFSLEKNKKQTSFSLDNKDFENNRDILPEINGSYQQNVSSFLDNPVKSYNRNLAFNSGKKGILNEVFKNFSEEENSGDAKNIVNYLNV